MPVAVNDGTGIPGAWPNVATFLPAFVVFPEPRIAESVRNVAAAAEQGRQAKTPASARPGVLPARATVPATAVPVAATARPATSPCLPHLAGS